MLLQKPEQDVFIQHQDLGQMTFCLLYTSDSGNEVYYEGFPLILVNEKVIDNYEVIDVVELDDLRSGFISIIKVDMLTVNNQLLENIYVGIINGIRYDCLLNKSLMGGIL